MKAAVTSALVRQLKALRFNLLEAEEEFGSAIELAAPEFRKSIRNLAHYLALRRHDLRELQQQLASIGLSSLGRSESHVLANLEAVLEILHRVKGEAFAKDSSRPAAVGYGEGAALLRAHTEALFGARPAFRDTYIMATAPLDAAYDHSLLKSMLEGGMNCLRINCGYDDAAAWAGMIENVRRAERDLGRSCKVLMDLSGPKFRVGPLEDGPRAVSWSPRWDWQGRVIRPAVVAIAPNGVPLVPRRLADAALFAPAHWVSDLSAGDVVELDDLRPEHVRLEVIGRTGDIVLTHCEQTGFAAPECIARKLAADGARGPEIRIGELPPTEEPIRLKAGDTLIVRQGNSPGRRAIVDDYGRTTAPAVICCDIAELYADVRENEPVWFDDGRIGGIVRAVRPGAIEVVITKSKPRGSKLRANKGINFPNSNLSVSAISNKDIQDLDFVAQHADIVGMSFASRPEDIVRLYDLLEERKANLPVILKIETLRGFNRLPQLLMTAMSRFPLGLMIARGDCAVECGFERLAEVQEEILWLCEAAHVPVVWATQVLETLSKEGYSSRAEVTDAAMAERAECVMLGRGPYVVEAVASLDGILRRMEAHQMKKMSRLRRLHVSEQTFTISSNRNCLSQDASG